MNSLALNSIAYLLSEKEDCVFIKLLARFCYFVE